MSRVRALVCVLLAIGPALACGGEDSSGSSRPPRPSEPRRRSPRAQERPLPAFSGWTLDDQRLDISTLHRQAPGRLLLRSRETRPPRPSATRSRGSPSCAASTTSRSSASRSDRAARRRRPTRREHGIDFPVIDDGSRRIAQRLGLARPRPRCSASTPRAISSGRSAQFPAPGPGRGRRRSKRRSARRCACPDSDEAVPGDRPIAPHVHRRGARPEGALRSRLDARPARCC